MQTLDVTLPGRSHEILVEPGVLPRLGEIVARVAPHDATVLAVDANVATHHGRVAAASLEAAGYRVLVHELVAEERDKTMASVSGMHAAMLARRLERGSPVVAIGGGVIGDVAGFVAATYLRGVPFVQVPTTLLAMVDASIGGKTGVNFPLPAADGRPAELGKNLIGAFWQPRVVVVDPEVLATLETRDFRCGLAESIKHGILADAGLLEEIEVHADAIAALDPARLESLISRSAKIKIGFVQDDERESGRRALLNLGHTFAHAIEPIAALDLRHGEAVAIGLCAAARCAVTTGRLTEADADRIAALVALVGLPRRLRSPEPIARLVEMMGFDKKVEGGRLRLVLPTGLGRAELAADVPPEAIVDAWSAVGAGE